MATNLQNMNWDVVKPVAINSCIHLSIRPFATVLLFRNEDITTDAAILLPFAIFGGCYPCCS